MLRALWFFAQLAVVVCAAIWISMQKGVVDIQWNDYAISLHLGIFLLFLTIFTIVALVFFKIFGVIAGMPSGMSRRRRERNRRKGFQALTRGFAAIAAGDAKKATTLAKDVRHLLPDETGLPILLEAQAARLRGEEGEARKSFEKLLGDKDAAFFGVRGLLKSSLDEGDTLKALAYAKSALEQNPKQSWILKSVYDLEIQNHQWVDASKTLERAKKYKAIDEAQAKSDEIALLMILSEDDLIAKNDSGWFKKIDRILKLDPSFVPAAVKLADYYLANNKIGKATSLIEKTWKVNPHPELIVFWDRLSPAAKGSDPLRRLRWFEKLVAMRPDHADGQLAAAKVAMESGLNGEARVYMTTAESLRPSARLYFLRADLEEATTHNPSSVRTWMDKAAHAQPDDVWYCALTGVIYEHWSPIAQPHGSFNTIRWGNPMADRFMVQKGLLQEWKDPLLTENN